MPEKASQHCTGEPSEAEGRALVSRRVWLTLWGPPLAWMAFIFFLSAQPELSGLVPVAFEGDDTVAHMALYGVLGLLVWRAALRGGGRLLGRRPGRWALAIGWSYGVLDEIHQAFVPARAPELRDVTIDGIGVALGIAVAWIMSTRLAKREQADGTNQ